jgi:hypothetical protein
MSRCGSHWVCGVTTLSRCVRRSSATMLNSSIRHPKCIISRTFHWWRTLVHSAQSPAHHRWAVYRSWCPSHVSYTTVAWAQPYEQQIVWGNCVSVALKFLLYLYSPPGSFCFFVTIISSFIIFKFKTFIHIYYYYYWYIVRVALLYYYLPLLIFFIFLSYIWTIIYSICIINHVLFLCLSPLFWRIYCDSNVWRC